MFQTQLAQGCGTVPGALLSFLPGPIAIESSSMDWYTSLTMVLSAQWIFNQREKSPRGQSRAQLESKFNGLSTRIYLYAQNIAELSTIGKVLRTAGN